MKREQYRVDEATGQIHKYNADNNCYLYDRNLSSLSDYQKRILTEEDRIAEDKEEFDSL